MTGPDEEDDWELADEEDDELVPPDEEEPDELEPLEAAELEDELAAGTSKYPRPALLHFVHASSEVVFMACTHHAYR